jgi:hypothetical protein
MRTPSLAHQHPESDPMLQQELDSLTPSRDFSRRDFVRASVGTGFAAAVLPVMAQTVIKTDTTGLVAGEVMIPVGDFKMPAYRAAPVGVANAPVVLVVSEIFGVHEHIADVARRFAKAGYFAIAPEMFVRQGDAGSYGEVAKLIAEVISKQHVLLEDNHMMEVILVQGPASRLKAIADELITCKGVRSGKLTISSALIPPIHGRSGSR